MYQPGQLPGRSSVINGELQAGGNSICLLYLWLECSGVTPQKATMDNLRTLLWFVSFRRLNIPLSVCCYSRYQSRWFQCTITEQLLNIPGPLRPFTEKAILVAEKRERGPLQREGERGDWFECMTYTVYASLVLRRSEESDKNRVEGVHRVKRGGQWA